MEEVETFNMTSKGYIIIFSLCIYLYEPLMWSVWSTVQLVKCIKSLSKMSPSEPNPSAFFSNAMKTLIHAQTYCA